MRLWSKQLIGVLPNKQLRGQWRECCAIAKIIKEQKHLPLLVNRIGDYPLSHFLAYTTLVDAEMDRRGIGHRADAFLQYFDPSDIREARKVEFNQIFERNGKFGKFGLISLGWHGEHYEYTCLMNLSEKHDCGGLTDSEYEAVREKYLADVADSTAKIREARLAVEKMLAENGAGAE